MRTRKTILNLMSNLTLQIMTAIIGFILPRLMITTYGSSINGLILSIRQFLNYLAIVEAGVGNASTVALYKPLSTKNEDEINKILSATNIFYRKSGYIFLVLVILLAIFYPLFVKNEVDPKLVVSLIFILGFGGIWEFFLVGKYSVLLRADQKSYILYRMDTILLFLSTIIAVILIYFGYSITLVLFFSTIILLLNILLLKLYIKKHYPFFNIKVKPNTVAIQSKWDALVHQIAGLVVFNTPIIIITIFTNLQEVSVYSIYSMVFSAITLIISTFSTAVTAAFGDLIVRGQQPELQKNFSHFEFIFFAMTAFFYTATSILILPFIEVYTSGIHDAQYVRPILSSLFIMVGIANTLRIPSTTIVISAGHFKETKNRAIIESFINLVASLIFVHFYGMEGVLFGSLCSYAYRTIDLIFYTSNHILKRSIKCTVHHIVRNGVLSLIAVSPFVFSISVHVHSFLHWFMYAVSISSWILFVIIVGNYLVKPNTMREIFLHIRTISLWNMKGE